MGYKDEWDKNLKRLDKITLIFFITLSILAVAMIVILICDVIFWNTVVCTVIGAIGAILSSVGLVVSFIASVRKK